MNLFDLFVKIGVKDDASSHISKLANGLGKGLQTAGKIGVAAVGAAATGIATMTATAVNSFADYEQLVGGVETLFEKSADKVKEYADIAYQTAGLSANEYMENVTSFSASLLQSLGGDTEAAAEYANVAMIDMSDNANKMGSSMESITNAYQGFAKGNFTMLDNLKLGYGGTKEEMARLIADAAKLDSGIDANDQSFGNIVKSIHAVQENMGIAGTTAKEASETISGSIGTMKSAWENWLTSLGSGEDVAGKTQQLVESVLVVADNIMPAMQTVLEGIASTVTESAPKIIETLISTITDMLPSVIESAVSLVSALINGIVTNLPKIVEAGKKIVPMLIDGISSVLNQLSDVASKIITSAVTYLKNNFGKIVETGTEILSSLIDGVIDGITDMLNRLPKIIEEFLNFFTENLPKIIKAGETILKKLIDGVLSMIPDMLGKLPKIISSFVGFITENLPQIIDSGADILLHLVSGIINTIPELVAQLPEIIISFVQTIAENLPKIVESGVEILLKLTSGILEAIPKLAASVPELIGALIDGIVDSFPDIVDAGKRIVSSIWEGIKSAWEGLKNWFTGIWNDLFGSKNVNVNVHGTTSGDARGAYASGLEYVPYNGFTARLHRGEMILTADEARKYRGNAGSGVNVTQNIYSRAMTAADLMQEAQYNQEMAVLGLV